MSKQNLGQNIPKFSALNLDIIHFYNIETFSGFLLHLMFGERKNTDLVLDTLYLFNRNTKDVS
jgi:hypothetical protein